MTVRNYIFCPVLVLVVCQMLIGSICASPLYSSSSIQTIPGSTPLFRLFGNGFTVDELAEDVDVIYYHLEHYGVPWTLFTETSTPFDYWNWTKAMNEFAAAYEPHRDSKPLMLGTVMSRGTFSTKAELGLNGGIDLADNWFAECPDMWYYSQYIQAYSVYLQYLIKTFKPKYICMAVEISAHLKKCGTLYWNETVIGYNIAYDNAKKAASNLGYEVILFPSFILTDLYDDKLEGFNQTTWDLLSGLKRDRLALSSYPQGTTGNDANKLPMDYFTRLASLNNETLIISETGWNSDPVVVAGGNCQTLIEGSESTQAAYMARLGELASSAEIVVWWSSRDLIPANVMTTCYNGTCGDDVWCQYVQYFRSQLGDVMGDLSFKVFGTMGFKTWGGETKSESYSEWNKLRGVSDNTPMNSNSPSTTQPIGMKNGSSIRSPFIALLLVGLFALVY